MAGMIFQTRSRASDILSACKAEEGGDTVASLTDNNTADVNIDSAESAVTDQMEY